MYRCDETDHMLSLVVAERRHQAATPESITRPVVMDSGFAGYPRPGMTAQMMDKRERPRAAGPAWRESMTITRNLIVVAALLATSSACAQYTDGVVKIGVLSDMSSLYADVGGPGSVAAAKLAVADFGAAAKGIKVEIVSGDHQNKPDVGSSLAGSWFDVDKVDVIVDVPNSGVALAVSEVARQKNKLFLVSGAAASDLTGPKCNVNTIHWTYDTWNLANGTGKAMVKTGGDTWFFITADYAFGQALERDTAAVVEANGGKVLGRVRHPLNNNDFSSFLLQAQASKAKIIGLANAGADTR